MNNKEKQTYDNALKALISGKSIAKVCSFFCLSQEDLKNYVIKKGYKGLKAFTTVENSKRNNLRNKIRIESIISYANEYKKRGKSLQNFVEDLKESQRIMTEDQLILVKKIFDANSKEKKQEEIEI